MKSQLLQILALLRRIVWSLLKELQKLLQFINKIPTRHSEFTSESSIFEIIKTWGFRVKLGMTEMSPGV